ncbi:MAG: D-tyrosyl-tRNA(Tyr) deacylase [Desulfobacteraceae bacterium]|nr:MAG: D-tyrosyl-tRNA(Tyr) deacylase [Desulfobacteraceae bacterium]
MRAVIQRVTSCSVSVENQIISHIGPGLLVLLGVAQKDEPADADWLADKIAGLRVFEDENGKMNRSLLDTGGEIMVVSQFTLYGDCRKGRRPSFTHAAPPETAEKLYLYFAERMTKTGIPTQTGQFQAMMAVSLVNDGPVTLIIDSSISLKQTTAIDPYLNT